MQVYEVPRSSSSNSSSSGGASVHSRNSAGQPVLLLVEAFELLPEGAIIVWNRSTFRGQLFARHLCKKKEQDPERWPELMHMIGNVVQLQVPGVTAKRVQEALEK
jgi:hypothetical protein